MKMIKTGTIVLAGFAILFSATISTAQISTKKKILFVVTSHDKKGSTGEPTGYYLGEVSHPWEVLKNAGYEIDFVSPKGGKAPVDGFDLKDKVNAELLNDKVYHNKVEHTKKDPQ